jgi:hypothetical protein
MMNRKECVRKRSWSISRYYPSISWENTEANGVGIITHSIPAAIHLKIECHKISHNEHTLIKKSPKSVAKRRTIWTAVAAAF